MKIRVEQLHKEIIMPTYMACSLLLHIRGGGVEEMKNIEKEQAKAKKECIGIKVKLIGRQFRIGFKKTGFRLVVRKQNV